MERALAKSSIRALVRVYVWGWKTHQSFLCGQFLAAFSVAMISVGIIDSEGNNLYEEGRKEYLEAHKEI